MSSKPWAARLSYVAMSAFVTWHTFAMVIAPAPSGSALAQSLRAVLDPYLTLFQLDNRWDFYSPEIGSGEQFRYNVEDAAGTIRSFSPIDELSWWHPAYWWFKAWHTQITKFPDAYGNRVAAELCVQHASLKPVAVTLIHVRQLDFQPADHLAGKSPLDPEFVEMTPQPRFQCPGT